MRPKHYVKNLLVFVPLLFSGRLLAPGLLVRAGVAFAAFCLLSSVIYIVNDLKDVENDRAHSVKRFRPLASGEASQSGALLLAAALLLISAGLVALTGGGWKTWLCAAAYLLINALYSVAGWKNIALVDVLLLVAGFLLRLAFGASVVRIVISNWLYLTVISISFYLGFGKRRNELRTQADAASTRKSLGGYTEAFLDKAMYTCMTLGITFYSLWSMDAGVMAHHANPYAIWSVPLVMALAFRYSMDVENASSGDPVEVMLTDRVIWVLGAIYALTMFWVVYGFGGAR